MVSRRIVCLFGGVALWASLFSSGCGMDSNEAKNDESSESLSIATNDPVAGPLFQQYKVLPYLSAGFYRHEWEDYGRCLPQAARDSFAQVAQKLAIDKYDLFTVAMGEGLGFYFDEVPDANELVSGPVDGYVYLGVDFFLDDLPSLKREGLISQNFLEGVAFTTRSVIRNEPGDNGVPIQLTVPVFTNLRFALEATGAYFTGRLRLAQQFAARNGLGTLNRDQKTFWAYYFYQNPSLARQSMLNSGKGAFVTKPDSVRPKDIRSKAMKRVVTARYLEGYRVLENGVSCSSGIFF